MIVSGPAFVASWLALIGSVPERAGGPAVDPCTLVTKTEIQQIIGKPTGTPKPERNDKVEMCSYPFSADPGDALELWVYPAEAWERARKELKELAPVAGLGQGALLYRDKRFDYVRLLVKTGKGMLEVRLSNSPGDEDKVKAVARKALGRI